MRFQFFFFTVQVSLQTSKFYVFRQNCSKFSALTDEVEPAVLWYHSWGISLRRKMGEMPFHLELIKLNSWWESIFLLWLSCRHFFQFSCHKVSDAVVGGKRITQYQDQGCWSCQEIKPKAMLMNIEYTLSLLWKWSATSDSCLTL